MKKAKKRKRGREGGGEVKREMHEHIDIQIDYLSTWLTEKCTEDWQRNIRCLKQPELKAGEREK